LAMVAGKVRAPYLYLQNEKLCGAIYMQLPCPIFGGISRVFGNVDSFFFNPKGSGTERVRQYLESHRKALKGL